MKSLCENIGKCFGAKMKNRWEGQFINPSVCYKCNVLPVCSSVLNNPVNPEPCYLLFKGLLIAVQKVEE